MFSPSASLIKALGLESRVDSQTKFVEARGCKFCGNSGYKGRVGIFEILRSTPEIQQLIISKASVDEIREVARKQGMRTLREAAMDKLLSGVTTVQEIMRVTQQTEA